MIQLHQRHQIQLKVTLFGYFLRQSHGNLRPLNLLFRKVDLPLRQTFLFQKLPLDESDNLCTSSTLQIMAALTCNVLP